MNENKTERYHLSYKLVSQNPKAKWRIRKSAPSAERRHERIKTVVVIGFEQTKLLKSSHYNYAAYKGHEDQRMFYNSIVDSNGSICIWEFISIGAARLNTGYSLLQTEMRRKRPSMVVL